MSKARQKLLSATVTTEELAEGRPRLAVLPIGATEQHSGHLPLATDTILIEALAGRIAGKLGAYCLPALPYSISQMHRGLRGTVWLSNQTLARVLADLARSLQDDGFEQLVLLNGHGGNLILPAIVQDLNWDLPGLLTIELKPADLIAGSGIFTNLGTWRHADEFETACLLYLHPEWVRRDRLRDQTTEPDRDLLRCAPFKAIARLTHTGRPTRATAEQGRRAIEFLVAQSVAYIRRMLHKAAACRKKRR